LLSQAPLVTQRPRPYIPEKRGRVMRFLDRRVFGSLLLGVLLLGAPADTLVQEGEAAWDRRDYTTAAARFLEALEADPDGVEARVGYIVSLMALDRDTGALPVVLEGMGRRPEQGVYHELLGDLRYRADRLDEALRAWQAAMALTPRPALQAKIDQVEQERSAASLTGTATSSHFQVIHDGDVDRAMAREVIAYLESSLSDLSRRFGHSPARPITVVLYSDRQFRAATGAADWVGGLYDGKVRVPLGGLNRLDPVAERLLTHELSHALIHSLSSGHCPRWLHEGLAQVLEGRSLLRSERQAVVSDLQAWDPSTGEPPPPFSYPTALSLTRFMEASWGFDTLVRVVEGLGRGSNMDSALRQATGMTFREVLTRWRRSVLAGDG
jgi:hypothetical protein